MYLLSSLGYLSAAALCAFNLKKLQGIVKMSGS